MNIMPMLCEGCKCLDSIVLKPKLTLSLSSYNRRTGYNSQQQCISFSTGFTLLRGMIMLAGGTAVAYGAMCYLRRKERKKMCHALKMQTKQSGKMAKS